MQTPSKTGRWMNSLLFRVAVMATGIVMLLWSFSIYYLNQEQQETARLFEDNGKIAAEELAGTNADLLLNHDMTTLQHILEKTEVGIGYAGAAVFNEQGQLVGEVIRSTVTGANPDGVTPGATSSPAEDLLYPVTQIRQVLQTGNAQTVRTDNYFMAIHPVISAASTQSGAKRVIGAVVIEMSLSPIIQRSYQEITERGLLVITILVIMIGFMIPLLYRSTIRPIRQVIRGTQAIAAGQFDTILPVKGSTEVTDLAMAFNRMASDLQSSQSEMQKHMDELKIIHDISMVTSRTMDLDQILDGMTHYLADLLESYSAVIFLWDHEANKPSRRSAYGLDLPPEENERYLAIESAVLSLVIQTRQQVFLGRGMAQPGFPQDVTLPPPIQSVLGLPLIANDQAIGAVLAADTQPARPISEHQVRVAMSAIQQVAAAIANATLFSALDAERNRLDEILNAVSDGIIVQDTAGNPLFVNPAFFQLTGWSNEALRSQPHWIFLSMPEDLVEAIRVELHTALAAGGSWRREMRITRPDGSAFDADLAATPIRDRNKKQVGFVTSLRDISQLKEVDQIKNRFVSTVSHELRTPLSVINLYTENLLEFYDQLDDDQRRGLLNDIHTETNTLHQLIEHLLSLSRLDSGRAEPRRKEINLGEALLESISSVLRLADEKGLDLTYHLPDQPMSVYADSDQLGQVFRNLLSNAIKFTPAGGKVSVDMEARDKDVVVKFSDSGIGIPPGDITRLFERFFRSELSVLQEIPGTGLGLAISREIILRHQGTISVVSEVGKGSTFYVTLPQARTNQPTIVRIEELD
jgi:PAS domain S-box-containing protein